MKFITRLCISSLILLHPFMHPVIPYVHPQPGENLWGLVAREGVAIDYLLDHTCTGSTAGCDFTITQADIGIGGTYTISAPGKYCLSESVTYTTSNAITINTQGVILDLGQFEIRRTTFNPDPTTSGAIVDFGGQNIIQNGTIYNDTVLLNSFNTLIRDCVTEAIINVPCSIITGTGSVDCTIDSCQVRKSLGACFQLLGPNTIARNCSATAGNSDGFFVAGDNCEISNCVSAYNSNAGINNQSTGLVVCNNSVHNNFFNYINTSESSLCSLITSAGCDFTINQADIGTGGTYTISAPGKYCLTESVTYTTSNAITINTQGVILDLGQFEIRRTAFNPSPTTSGAIVDFGGQNIIQNGTIYNDTVLLNSFNTLIRDCVTEAIINVPCSIITGTGSVDCTIDSCQVRKSLGACFQLLGPNTIARNCSATAGNSDGFFVAGDNCEISNCVSAYNSNAGINNQSTGLVVCNNSVHNNFFNYINTSESSLCSLITSAGCDFTINQADIGTGGTYVISAPGKYCLTESVTYDTSNAITINSANVILDLGQFEIRRTLFNPDPATTGAIVDFAGHNIIQNGTIYNDVVLLAASNSIVRNCVAESLIPSPCSIITGTVSLNNTIDNCQLRQCFGAPGFQLLGSNTVVRNCSAIAGLSDGFSVAANNCEISNCVSAYNSNVGIRNLGTGLVVCNNSVHNNLFNYVNTSESSLCSLISQCCPCQFFITNSNVPNYIISQPGIYCVTEPLTLGPTLGQPVIDVQSSDVVLDFRGNRVSSPAATAPIINISTSVQNIIIRNAIIDFQGPNSGINIAGGANNVIIENCMIENPNGRGIVCDSSNNIVIQHCVISHCFGQGILITNGTNQVTVKNCQSVFCVVFPGNGSFEVNNTSSNVIFDSCSTSSSSGGLGFRTDSSSFDIICNNCQADSNTQAGFSVDSPSSRIENCVARFNGGNGFTINPSASATTLVEVVGCVASNNGGDGFNNGLLANSHVFNSVSTLNSGSSYTNVTAATLVASAAVTTATGYWSNISG